jgi:hypothetical protein
MARIKAPERAGSCAIRIASRSCSTAFARCSFASDHAERLVDAMAEYRAGDQV